MYPLWRKYLGGRGEIKMSVQAEIERVLNEELSPDEIKEALTDILLVLTNTNRNKAEQYELIEEIYKERIFNKFLV